MATDFRSGREFPRRGREALGGVFWLARVFDKARAAAAGTIHDYIYPCPMDRGVFERWGISSDDFDRAIAQHTTDEAILAWLESRVSPGSAKPRTVGCSRRRARRSIGKTAKRASFRHSPNAGA